MSKWMVTIALAPLAALGLTGCGSDEDDLDSFLDDLPILDVAVDGMAEQNGGSSRGLAFRDFDIDPDRAEDVFGRYTDALVDVGWKPILDDDALFSALRAVDGCDLTAVAAIEGDDDRIFVSVRPRTEQIEGEPAPSCPLGDDSG